MATSTQFDNRPSRKGGFHPLRARPTVRGSTPLVRIDPARLQQVYIVAKELRNDPGAAPVICPGDIAKEAKELRRLNIERVKVFVRGEVRDETASEASNSKSFVIEVIKRWKDEAPDICLATETCLCPFTTTGLCGVYAKSQRAIAEGTYSRLVDLALAQAEAGADILGVANMIDDSVFRVKEALSSEGWQDIPIVPHLIVGSDWVYGPFRQATGVDPHVDRSATQVHPAHADQVVDQLQRFVNDGASRVLLEPGYSVMDHLVRLTDIGACPVDAFVVSGEYRMAMQGRLGSQQTAAMTAALFRAGADTVATYAAKDLARKFAI